MHRVRIILEAIFGGVAVAVIGGLIFYYAGLLFLSLISAVLPLAGGRPKMLLDRRKKKTNGPTR